MTGPSKTIAAATAFAIAAISSASAADIAYALASSPGADSYPAPADYLFNAGQPAAITRSAVGRYHVAFGRVADAGANVQVSLYGDDTGYCNVQSWGGGGVNIACFDAAGRPANRRFSVLAIKAAASDAPETAYAWLHDPRPSGFIAASPQYAFGESAIRFRRTGAGVYSARLGAFAQQNVVPFATAYGSNGRCAAMAKVNIDVLVRCVNGADASADMRSSLLVLRRGFPGYSFATVAAGARLLPEQSWSSDGSTQSVTRLSTGRYRVRVGPEAAAGGAVIASSFFLSLAECHVASQSAGAATIACNRGASPADSPFIVGALKGDGPDRRIRLANGLWTGLLKTAASGLSVRINNYDRTHSQPRNGRPEAFRAFIENDSTIDYTPKIEGAGDEVHIRFTPTYVWRDPLLFLLNDINLRSRAIAASADHGAIVLALPFESDGREAVSSCHENAACGWGPDDGNNRAGAEIDNLVLSVPFRATYNAGTPHVRTTLGHVTYTADVRRAGYCHNNAFGALCDIFAGDAENQIRQGIESSINAFVAQSGDVLDRMNAGINAAVCQLAAARGRDCAQLRDFSLEENGDITLVF
ncbi:MAG: hypothetical protein GC153_07155 [Alphaproteobacteria bacterium]|nr:hypothetical protein [Alphaproteobacteria bacterium]